MRQNLDLQAFIADGTVSTHFGDGFAAVIYPMVYFAFPPKTWSD
jgi:hypothetical protein